MKIPQSPPPLAQLGEIPPSAFKAFTPEVGGKYLHWDELRRRPPPTEVDHRTWWTLVALARKSISRPIPLIESVDGKSGRQFVVAAPDSVLRLAHTIDQDASGQLTTSSEGILGPGSRDKYVMTSLIEEAITSSQLEGASTTRRVAKEMLLTQRKPRTPDERMILANHKGMQWVRERVAAGDRITVTRILELHSIVHDDHVGAGRFRRPDEDINVQGPDGQVLHTPPPAGSLKDRVELLCGFANQGDEGPFIHPVVRAILLHFWLAYDHPFVDGNGRTARALFYWSMLARRYWLTEFVSISRLLRKSPAQYAEAFLYSEADADATYFVVHQLRTLRQAIDDLTQYVTQQTQELKATESLLRSSHDLNHRQLQLLGDALRDPDAVYDIAGHQGRHAVVYQTARQDLLDLVNRGWFEKSQRGRMFVFRPVADLERRLRAKRKS